MFGYVIVNKDELKIREFREYRSYYCGLCHALGKHYGVAGRFSVSYDVTFLAILLTGLYEPEEERRNSRCIAHPLQTSEYVQSSVVDYAAHMNVLLTYYKCRDDFNDEKKCRKQLYGKYLGSKGRYLAEVYPDKCKELRRGIARLELAEQAGEESPDVLAGYFGEVLRCIFRYRRDEWYEELGEVGYHLGKFIYLLDAYEDYEDDCKRGDFNPLMQFPDWSEEQRKQYVADLLQVYATECARAFERLPILTHAELLRNILYAGIWSVYCGRCGRNMKPRKRSEE